MTKHSFGMVLVALTLEFLCGCRDYDVLWSSESRSPNGNWLATAREEQGGGFGNAYDLATVSLKQVGSSRKPVEILEFSMTQSRKLNLTMTWRGPTRLDVAYDGRAATVEFQVVKYAGIEISTKDLSSAANSSSNSAIH